MSFIPTTPATPDTPACDYMLSTLQRCQRHQILLLHGQPCYLCTTGHDGSLRGERLEDTEGRPLKQDVVSVEVTAK